MSLPEPPSSLDSGCSVVHDNILYVFTPTAFMSLSLEEGAEWKELKMGQQVTGGVCVGAGSALFVVGGSGGPADFNGLQKYIFADEKWESVETQNQAFRNLQYHGATYIKNTDQIVVSGGSQDGREVPSDTSFYFAASDPSTPMAVAGAKLSVNPILIPWSDDEACMVGGSDWNTRVSVFNAATSWTDKDITLAAPLTPSSKALVLQGDDGSKSLYVFDLSASPNTVSRYVVWDDKNAPGQNAANQNKKRDLSQNNWPSYNATLAPTATRAQGQYSIAQDSNGRVVFVGGNQDEPLAFFDMKENSWLDAANIIGDEQKILSAETSSSTTKTKLSSTKTSSSESSTKTKSVTSDSSSTSATSTASATGTDDLFTSTVSESSSATNSDVAPIGSGNSDGKSGLSSNAILGITLGTILGFIALLIVILLLLRRRKKTRQPSPESAPSRQEFPNDKKDPMGLGGGPASPFRAHHPNMSQESFSSMAILMGRTGKNKPSISRKLSHGSNGSSGSAEHNQLKSSIGKPVLQEMQHPALQGQDTRGVAFDPNVAEPRPRNGPLETQDGLRRSSGWNRYWSGGSALQILGFGGPKRNTVASDTDSHYSDQVAHHRNPRVTQDSATVPPLNFEFRPEMSRVNTGSPIVSEYDKNIPFRDGVAGKIERPISKATSGYSSGIPESVNETWDPDYKDKPWGTDRATSSIYNPSFYFGAPLSPRVPPPQTPPSGVSTQPQLAMSAQSSDMSWLNLGDRSRK
ncbi:hypothetical protein FGRMN_9765 [Fusarium graminum]|nr:hypothetical protein FGRMN_9765 [Fusarium graminum]